MSLQNITMESQNVPVESIFSIFGGGWVGVILLFVLSLGLLMFLLSINPQNVVLKHIVWLVFVLYLGFLTYPSYIQTIQENTVIVTLLTTKVISCVFSSSIVKPEWISLSWTRLMFLLVEIIGELCFYFSRKESMEGRMIFIFFQHFSLYLFYMIP